MIVKSAELETVCGITSKLPDNDLPEIAFAGKSNVGKSSLINGLLNRKSLARTSAQPGKTQTINFYNVNKNLYFVDLPGYGYAKVSVEIRAKWGKMIRTIPVIVFLSILDYFSSSLSSALRIFASRSFSSCIFPILT